MRILDKYIFRSILAVFLLTVVIFGILFILIDSAVNLDEFIDRKVTIEVLVQYYLSYLPVILIQTVPMALLIAVLLIYSNLNAHNELIVLRASGLNFWQITKPALATALVVTACVFLINEKYIPLAEEKTKQLKNENLILEIDRRHKNLAKIKNLTFYGLKNRLYFIDSFDPNTYELSGITIISYDDSQKIVDKLVALKGIWTGIAWKFFQCNITTFSETINSKVKVKVYEEKLVDIKESPEDFLKQRLNVTAMNIHQLKEYIHRFEKSGAKRALNNLRVDYHQKFSFPVVNLVIVLSGLPFALATGRRRAQTFTSLGIAVGIGFLYYVANAVGLALGKGGVFPPMVSAWLAPVLFFGSAIYFIKARF